MDKELDERLKVIYSRCDVSNNRTDDPLAEDEAGLVYNHDFAKALWGEEEHTLHFPEGEIHRQSPVWQYHLQQMVIAADPIQYLGMHLDK